MAKLTSEVKKFVASESGATMIEYGLIASIVSIAALVGLNAIKPKILKTFQDVAAAL